MLAVRTASAAFLRHSVYTARKTPSPIVSRAALSHVTTVMAAGQDQAAQPSYHVLRYTYVPDILEKRDPYRAAHLQGAKDMAAASKIVMAGALTDPVDGAVFIFRNVSAEEIEAFVRKDPYVINGLVPHYGTWL